MSLAVCGCLLACLASCKRTSRSTDPPSGTGETSPEATRTVPAHATRDASVARTTPDARPRPAKAKPAPLPEPKLGWPEKWSGIDADKPKYLEVDSSDVVATIRKLEKAGALDELEGLSIDQEADDEIARLLARTRMPKLAHLSLVGCAECAEDASGACRLAVCKRGMKAMAKAPWAKNLRSLVLITHALGPRDIAVIGEKFPNLAYLKLMAQNVGSDARWLSEARGLRQLRTLELRDTDLAYEGLRRILLSPNLPALEYVKCNDSCQSDDPLPKTIGRFRIHDIRRPYSRGRPPDFHVRAVAE